MKTYMKYLLAALFVMGAGTLFYKKVYLPKHTYKVTRPTKETLTLFVKGIGTVDAKDIYKVTAGVNAKIMQLETDLGKWVKKGDLLFRLDPVDLPATLDAAKIAVKKSLSEVVSLKKELESLKAQKRLAQVTFDRYARLKKESFASQAEYDQAKAQLDSLSAQINATKARIDSAKISVEIAQKNVRALQEKLKRFSVYAPVNGIIVAKNAEVGQTVVASWTVFEIVRKEDVWIKAYIDERQSQKIKPGKKAFITLRSQSDKWSEGYVARIAPKSDAVTEEREVDVAFSVVPMPFYLNEQAEVNIETQKLQDVLTVPASLLRFHNGIQGVWVEKEGKAYFKKVQVLGISGKKAAVSGLDSSDILLLLDPKKLPIFEGKRIWRE